MTGSDGQNADTDRYSDQAYTCPEGCYIPLVDRYAASHRHECPECGAKLVRRNDQ